MELEEREMEDERIRYLAAEILSFDNLGDLEDGNDFEPSEDSELLDGHEALCDFSLVEEDEFQNEDNGLSPGPEEADPSQSQEIMLASNLPEEGQEKKDPLDIIVILIAIVCAISELFWFVFVIIPTILWFFFWIRQKKILELIGQA